ncbi:MAG: LamB/YcsF family protein [Chloroflexota bacterium]
MAHRININCDMGEGYGRWTMGDDAALMPMVPSANIATGYHAGDPSIMRRTARLAKEAGPDIGAHVALPDLAGFGRRRMDISPQELQDAMTYQIGAMGAFAQAVGGKLVHVKPHGVLYAMAGQNEDLGRAVLTAVRDYDPDLIVILPGPMAREIGRDLGVRVIPEAYCDLGYHPDGYPVVERVKAAWDPEEVARRAVRIVLEQRGEAVDGTPLTLDMKTICIHGDSPNAVEVLRTVRQRLAEAGVEVVSLGEVI